MNEKNNFKKLTATVKIWQPYLQFDFPGQNKAMIHTKRDNRLRLIDQLAILMMSQIDRIDQ